MGSGKCFAFTNTYGSDNSSNSYKAETLTAVTRWANKLAKELLKISKRKRDSFNTASIVYDTKNDKYYYGRNNGIEINKSSKNAILFGDDNNPGILPEKSLNNYKVGNCAEVDAINNALNNGAKLGDLVISTIHTTKSKMGETKEACENCTYAFKSKLKKTIQDGITIMNTKITINTLSNISLNGRMAYMILCTEKYLIEKYPLKNWEILSKLMWESTSSMWDEWDMKFLEIIPEYLFEYDNYEQSDFTYLSIDNYLTFKNLFRDVDSNINLLLLNLHKLQEIYCYSNIPGYGTEASQIVLESCNILLNNRISLPDINAVIFSKFSEKNGWGNSFNGEFLSLILHK